MRRGQPLGGSSPSASVPVVQAFVAPRSIGTGGPSCVRYRGRVDALLLPLLEAPGRAHAKEMVPNGALGITLVADVPFSDPWSKRGLEVNELGPDSGIARSRWPTAYLESPYGT